MSGRDDDDAPFREFVAGRYPSLVRTAYLLTGDRGHAEDLVQTSLLRTYGAWRRLADPGNAEAYTRKVMVRLAGRWRARRWRGERPADRLPEVAAEDGAAAVDLADAVRSALLSLPVTQRSVLVLRFYEQRTEAEIADVLGCSVGTVKSRANRGLAALRTAGLLAEVTAPGDPEVRRG
jgi:RNA polymerase sigma-70 factor (sigma-E family)